MNTVKVLRMDLSTILTPDRCLLGATVKSRKKAFELIAQTVAYSCPQLRPNDIFDALIERERLGTTALTDGIALPHCRLSQLDAPIGCCVVLKQPIAYGSEHLQVQVLFALLVPKDADKTQLELLATLAQKFREADFRKQLLQAHAKEALYDCFI